MTIRKFFALFWLGLFLPCWTTLSSAETPLGQTLQINTRFRSIVGNPVWLLVIRDVDTGIVMPYMFDIKNNQDFWIAFTYSHNYRVTASNLKFGPFAVIKNFCHLENGVLTGKSIIINLSGDLTPSSSTFKCNVLKYDDSAFPIANQGAT